MMKMINRGIIGRLQYHFTTPKEIIKLIYSQQDLPSFIQLYNKEKQNMDVENHCFFLKKISSYGRNKNFPKDVVTDCLTRVLSNTHPLPNKNIIQLISSMTLAEFPTRVVTREHQDIMKRQIEKRFKYFDIKRKSHALNWLKKFSLHADVFFQDSRDLWEKESPEECAHFLANLLYVKKGEQAQNLVNHLYESVEQLSAKALLDFTFALSDHCPHLLREDYLAQFIQKKIESKLHILMQQICYLKIASKLGAHEKVLIPKIIERIQKFFIISHKKNHKKQLINNTEQQQVSDKTYIKTDKLIEMEVLLIYMIKCQCSNKAIISAIENTFIEIFLLNSLQNVKSFSRVYHEYMTINEKDKHDYAEFLLRVMHFFASPASRKSKLLYKVSVLNELNVGLLKKELFKGLLGKIVEMYPNVQEQEKQIIKQLMTEL